MPSLSPPARLAAFVLAATLALAAPAAAPRPEYIPFADAQPALRSAGPDLPQPLQGRDEKQLAQLWPAWVREQDSAVRERLALGEEDALVNFLLFGTSFTRHPRLTTQHFQELRQRAAGDQQKFERELTLALAARVRDLVNAMAAPRRNERVEAMRRILLARGHRLATPADKEKAARYIVQAFDRASREFSGYQEELARARATGDPDHELAVRARIFAHRGVALDTSLFPNLAIEEALRYLMNSGVLEKGQGARLAVVGPGLDFIDKREGQDFYPLQTLQPFALMDSALRLGLAGKQSVQVTTLDISDRVNLHLAGMTRRAAAGRAYTLQLPLEQEVGWEPLALRYWQSFGDQVGKPAPPVVPPPAAGKLNVRAVTIPAALVRRVHAADLNIVYQRLPLAARDRFDVIIGTNIFVYYGGFEQGLAMINAERMLRPGGVLLSNSRLPIPSGVAMESLGYVTTVYSDRPNDGDHIFIYRRKPE